MSVPCSNFELHIKVYVHLRLLVSYIRSTYSFYTVCIKHINDMLLSKIFVIQHLKYRFAYKDVTETANTTAVKRIFRMDYNYHVESYTFSLLLWVFSYTTAMFILIRNGRKKRARANIKFFTFDTFQCLFCSSIEKLMRIYTL